ncbi:MAG: hypothetical protein ACOY0T_12255 [Myxococcota bacterium]
MAPFHRGHPGNPAVSPAPDDTPGEYAPVSALPPHSPPPPPSARRVNASFTAPGGYVAPVQPNEASAVDQFAETTPRDEENPFQKPPARWRRWLKRPSREMMVRSGVAVVALGIGWGVGAKPWKPSPAARPVIAAKAPARAGAAKPTAPRRVAVMTHAAKPAPARAALQPTVVAAKASTTTKASAPVSKTVQAKTTSSQSKTTTTAQAKTGTHKAVTTTATKKVAAKPTTTQK